jgi:hypothetical protein
MKQALSILFLLAIMAQTMSLPVYYLYYKLNVDYITELYCVNKDKPKMQCNGKCHISKITQNALSKEKKDSPAAPTFEEHFTSNLFIEKIAFDAPKLFNTDQLDIPIFRNNYSFLHLHSIFHPPENLA